jgi:hypothetical protein
VGAMIDQIILGRPEDAQTILGTVSLHERIIVDGSVIEFTEMLSVLKIDEYGAWRPRCSSLRTNIVRCPRNARCLIAKTFVPQNGSYPALKPGIDGPRADLPLLAAVDQNAAVWPDIASFNQGNLAG